jgi:hypothetical protein
VLLGLPDLRPDAMAKLNEIADLERVGRHGKTSRAFRPVRQAAVSGPRTAAARRARMSSPPGMSLQRALAPNGATCRSTMGSLTWRRSAAADAGWRRRGGRGAAPRIERTARRFQYSTGRIPRFE